VALKPPSTRIGFQMRRNSAGKYDELRGFKTTATKLPRSQKCDEAATFRLSLFARQSYDVCVPVIFPYMSPYCFHKFPLSIHKATFNHMTLANYMVVLKLQLQDNR